VCCSVLQCVAVCCSALQCVAVCCSVLQCVARVSLCEHMCASVKVHVSKTASACVPNCFFRVHVCKRDKGCTGWRRLIGSPKLQIIFHKRATKYRSLLRKITYEDKGSCVSSPPCSTGRRMSAHICNMTFNRHLLGFNRALLILNRALLVFYRAFLVEKECAHSHW